MATGENVCNSSIRYVGHLCRDVKTMSMSDWIVFIDVVSPVVCSDPSFPQEVMNLWAPLRQALLYFTKYRPGQHNEAMLQKGQEAFVEYSQLAQKAFKLHKLSTIQLHSATVHLVDMVKAYGPSAFRMEFWVERMMQVLKRVTKYRTTCSPELVAVNSWLLEQALMHLKALVPGVADLHERIDPKAKKEMAHKRDSHDAEGNALIGKMTDCPEELVSCLHLVVV